MRNADRYWAQFLASLPEGRTKPDRYVEAFFFGTDPRRAHEITRLVLDGTKTATGTLLWSIEADGKQPARPGDFWIVVDGADDPQCVIQTSDVQILPFDEVGEEYAKWGGEGDRTLDGWRHMYWSYIKGECERIGRTPDRKAPLVMERFRVVYAEPLGDPSDASAPERARRRRPLQDHSPVETEIRELSEVPLADWQSLFAGNADPFEIEHLHLSWRPKDTHFVLYSRGRAASHVSMVLRHTVRVGSNRIAVTGVAGVITRPDLRRRGLASRLLRHALSATRSREGSSFALLFCLPGLVPLYRALGWQEVVSAVHVEQPSGVVEAPLRTMVLALGDREWPAGPLQLDSAPW